MTRLISADCHINEPPHVFERVPAEYKDRAPKMMRGADSSTAGAGLLAATAAASRPGGAAADLAGGTRRSSAARPQPIRQAQMARKTGKTDRARTVHIIRAGWR